MPTASRKTLLHAAMLGACLAGLVAGAPAAYPQVPPTSGGATFVPPPPPPETAQLVNGRVIAPASAPTRVKRVIAAANRIVEKPYRYGGGHTPFRKGLLDSGYDCSGAVSYALFGGRFLRSPLPSGAMMGWGDAGPGQWITVYAHGGHAYLVVAGLRFDTSLRDPDAPGPLTGPRWSRTLRESAAFVARHPAGY
jgi:hypothetical protein